MLYGHYFDEHVWDYIMSDGAIVPSLSGYYLRIDDDDYEDA